MTPWTAPGHEGPHSSMPVPRTVPGSQGGIYWHVQVWIDTDGIAWHALYDAGEPPLTFVGKARDPRWFTIEESIAYEHSALQRIDGRCPTAYRTGNKECQDCQAKRMLEDL